MYAFTVLMMFYEVSMPQQKGKKNVIFFIHGAEKHIHLSLSMLINMTVSSIANYV